VSRIVSDKATTSIYQIGVVPESESLADLRSRQLNARHTA